MKLDDRMKKYEKAFTSQRFQPGTLPVIARMDGRAFHSFCKGLDKPFDDELIYVVQSVTDALIDETNADVGYCQSDEITLVWLNDDPDKELYFGGKLFKMVSNLASYTTGQFNHWKSEALYKVPNYKLAYFDARVWQVPSIVEASNALLWREEDATRNSISMLAQHHFSHKQLHGVSTREMLNMLSAIDVEWDDLEDEKKYGTHFKRVTTLEPFTSDELEELPPKHNARKNPDLKVERHYVEEFHITEPLMTEERISVLFGEDKVKPTSDKQ